MLFLSPEEAAHWRELGSDVLKHGLSPDAFRGEVRSNLVPMFFFYAGALLSAHGKDAVGRAWFQEGAGIEDESLFSNAFMAGFLKRHGGKLVMPAVCFEDPRPFVHFASTPELKSARENFVKSCDHSLPEARGPFKIMDIGTGNGALLVNLLTRLRETGKVRDIGEILLIDASPAMVELARKTVSAAFPDAPVRTALAKIQDAAAKIEGHYHVALSSLAYHHMPFETKRVHLDALKKKIDHFVIFEMDGDNDAHERYSPELACAVYQSYGRVMDYIFAHDAPMDVVQSAIDCFLMVEEVSFLTQPRGERSDYHMTRRQWHDLFQRSFGKDFSCRMDSSCHSDEFLDLIAIHYGRDV